MLRTFAGRDNMNTSNDVPHVQGRRRLSLAWLAVVAVAALVVGLLAISIGCQPSAALREGEPVPDFQLTAFDGTLMHLREQQGHVTVVNFFASWCTPCREEAADFQQTWLDFQSRGVQFYGIGYRDAASKAQAFLEEFGVTYPATVEKGNPTARAYGVTGVPETFIIDASGRLARHVIGPISRGDLAKEINRLLAP
jgi:cytochrome c biogenesis protein CcmG/thiol:disulfide interchange protein DsbE